jgi:YrbI family 3-deoxy-D-manno-octulosonate 8-phosphate phosphatase
VRLVLTAVAIIPARAGSKGIPRKNLQSVGGQSTLLERAVTTLSSIHELEVYVSSDSDEYLGIAKKSGAKTLLRPPSLAEDSSSSEDVLLHSLLKLSESGTLPKVVVLAQATSPFIQASSLRRAIEAVESGHYDVVFSAYQTFGFIWSLSQDDTAHGINHEPSERPRRQDREPHFMETGAFYVMNTEGFLRAKHRFFGRVGIEVVPEHSAIEIDTPEDLEIARVLATYFDSKPEALDLDALIMDFDGVHTDNSAYVSQSGEEHVRVSRSDGFGLEQLGMAGLPMLILSKEKNPVVKARAAKLGIPVLQGVEDKAASLAAWLEENSLDPNRTAYVGNDLNDLECMEIVGLPIAVADAEIEVKRIAKVVLKHTGGNGALREVSRAILKGKGLD